MEINTFPKNAPNNKGFTWSTRNSKKMWIVFENFYKRRKQSSYRLRDSESGSGFLDFGFKSKGMRETWNQREFEQLSVNVRNVEIYHLWAIVRTGSLQHRRYKLRSNNIINTFVLYILSSCPECPESNNTGEIFLPHLKCIGRCRTTHKNNENV